MRSGAVLRTVLAQLVSATQRWSRGESTEAGIRSLRHWAIELAHRHYLECIPIYRRLAAAEGVARDADVDEIVATMLMPCDVFKSYQDAWLGRRDFAAMTAWLGARYREHPAVALEQVSDLQSWKRTLKGHGIYLMYSSGTSGRISVVPRDRATLSALTSNWRAHPHPVWRNGMDGDGQAFDCLVLGKRGKSLGIQAAGLGLAAMAARSHFLFDGEPTIDELRAATGRRTATGWDRAAPELRPAVGDAFERAVAFIRQSCEQGRPLLLFGPPFRFYELCRYVEADVGALALPADSIAISGGGWKGYDGAKIDRSGLVGLIHETLGIPPSHATDTYSTVELNCVIMTCAHGRYHVPPLVESVVLDPALRKVSDHGGSGELAFLDPFSTGCPGFLMVGDRCTLTDEECACGLSGWSIVGEIERSDPASEKGCAGMMSGARV